MINKYFKATPKKWKRLQLILKTTIGTLAASSYAMSNEHVGFWLLVGGAVLDMFIEILTGDDEPEKKGGIT